MNWKLSPFRSFVGVLAGAAVSLSISWCVTESELDAQETHAKKAVFENLGLGGGGTFRCPASSPHNPKLMFVSCDMGGFYRTEDGGKSWCMVNGRELGTGCPPAFHPNDPKVIIGFDDVEFGSHLLRRSTDGGVTWKTIPGARSLRGGISQIYWDRGNAENLLLCREGAAYRSTTEGETWESCNIKGRYFHIDQRSPRDRRVCFAAGVEGVWRSDDGGVSWHPKNSGLPGTGILGFCGASDAGTNKMALFCVVRGANGKVFRSADGADTWKELSNGLNGLGMWGFQGVEMAETNPDVVYAFCGSTERDGRIFKSADGGETWKEVWHPRGRNEPQNVEHGWVVLDSGWECGVTDLHVNRTNPDVVMNTDNSQVFITEDGGKSWHQVYTRRAPGQGEPGKGQRWMGIGLEPSGANRVRFDPFDKNRIYIGYMDFGFGRSADGGTSWRKGKPGCPWGLVTFDMVLDPKRKGVIYGAMSSTHDIPYWGYVASRNTRGYKGGVCVSENHADSWTPIFGHQEQKGPCTSIALDPESPVESRTLYVTSYGHGLFKSTDGGKTWQDKSSGLIKDNNKHVLQVRLAGDGTLYCLVTTMRTGGAGDKASWKRGGLYKSTDKAETWHQVNTSQPLVWPIDFALHPKDPNTIYIAACNAPNYPEGGIYKTTDGGKTWDRVRTDTDIDGCFSVAVHPDKPGIVYACTWGKGLQRSRDGGRTWEDVEGVPFMTILRVFFDPGDSSIMYVSTTGSSVWRGPAF